MAGGLGKRMESNLPKVLHEVVSISNNNIKLPMLIHVIKTSLLLNPSKIFIIVGKYKNIIEETINKYITNNELIDYVIQEEAQGTGHAILCSLPQIQNFKHDTVLILSGDVPLISLNTLLNLQGNNNKLLITKLDEPFGCGRIIKDNNNNIIQIVEEKDCTNEQKLIKFVNCGIYQIKVKDLINLVPKINNNNKANEYYLKDIIGLMIKNNINIDTFELKKEYQFEIKNVNTKKDLEDLNNYIVNIYN